MLDVIHKEGISRYLMDNPASAADIYNSKSVADLITFLNALPEDQRKRYAGIYVSLKPDTSAAEALDLMQKKDVNALGTPVEFIDTGDLRRVMLQTS